MNTTTVRLTPSAAERFPDIGPDTPGTVVQDHPLLGWLLVAWDRRGTAWIPRQDLRPDVAAGAAETET